MTASSPTTSATNSCRGYRRRTRGSSCTPRCWIGCVAASATPCCRQPDPQNTLETLERTNSFVVPLDRRGEWYRYHHLFAELLRNELERSEPAVVRGAQPSGDGLVHRQRPARRPPSSTVTRRVRRTPSPAWSTHSPWRSTTTVAWRPWRSGSAGSATTTCARYPALAVYRSVGPSADGTARGGRAVARPRRRGDLDRSRSPTAAPRSSPGSPTCGRA